jgi:hypothetical protein
MSILLNLIFKIILDCCVGLLDESCVGGRGMGISSGVDCFVGLLFYFHLFYGVWEFCGGVWGCFVKLVGFKFTKIYLHNLVFYMFF